MSPTISALVLCCWNHLYYNKSHWGSGGNMSFEKEIKFDGEITTLLNEWGGGDENALGKVFHLAYDQLRLLAHHYFKDEPGENMLQATAVVNEIYLRLEGGKRLSFRNRGHFFRMAAQMMRRILVDCARTRLAQKRGAGLDVSLEEWTAKEETPQPDLPTLIAVEKALVKLETRFPRLGRIVELRIFMGMNYEEIAKVLDISLATVKREWNVAKQRLFVAMNRR